MTRTLRNNLALILVVLGGLFILGTATGCDELLGYYGGLWGGYGFPASDYYNPYYDIQDVIDYRLDVMEWSNDGWDDYIRE